MPEDFYKVSPPANRQSDGLGLRALARDWAAWPGNAPDLIHRSQFNLFFDIGLHLFGRTRCQALDYALYVMEKREAIAPVLRPADQQRHFALFTV